MVLQRGTICAELHPCWRFIMSIIVHRSMRLLPAALLTAAAFLIPGCGLCQGDSTASSTSAAFHPGELWYDTSGVPINAHGGGFLYRDGTYYWFGEFKTAGPGGNVANVGISCYSSNDLYHWKNEGIALKVSQDPASEIVAGSVIERPKVIYNAKTKTYVMWFHLELKGQGSTASSRRSDDWAAYLHGGHRQNQLLRHELKD